MIGWKKRVLLRHYLEQGMTITAVAEMLGVGRRKLILPLLVLLAQHVGAAEPAGHGSRRSVEGCACRSAGSSPGWPAECRSRRA